MARAGSLVCLGDSPHAPGATAWPAVWPKPNIDYDALCLPREEAGQNEIEKFQTIISYSPRHRAWSRGRPARSRGMRHTSERVPSRLKPVPPSLPHPPVPRPAPQGATLPHPALPVHAALGRAPPCSGARRRGCRAALDAREYPRRGVAAGRGALPRGRRKSAFEFPLRTSDFCALELYFPDDGHRVLSYVWIPEARVKQRAQLGMREYENWVRSGH